MSYATDRRGDIVNATHTAMRPFDPFCPCDECRATREHLNEKHFGGATERREFTGEVVHSDDDELLLEYRVTDGIATWGGADDWLQGLEGKRVLLTVTVLP